jgi:hypothetical protein
MGRFTPTPTASFPYGIGMRAGRNSLKGKPVQGEKNHGGMEKVKESLGEW